MTNTERRQGMIQDLQAMAERANYALYAMFVQGKELASQPLVLHRARCQEFAQELEERRSQ